MSKNDFFAGVILAISLIFLSGITFQNFQFSRTFSVKPQPIDVAALKASLQKAGLVPREAKYWKTLTR